MSEMSENQPPSPPTRTRRRSANGRTRKDRFFATICIIAASMSVVTLAALLGRITYQGLPNLDWQFLSGVPSRDASIAGIWPATVGTIMICLVCALTAIPIGVGTAILLEEFKPKNRYLRKAQAFVQLNITNLAGVPSIVYGLLGLTAFAMMFGLMGDPRDPAFEAGISYYDQYLTPAGEVVLAKAASKDAPLAPAGEVKQFYHAQTRSKVEVRVVPAAELQPQLDAMDDDLERLEDGIEKRIEAAKTVDDAGLLAMVKTVWAEAGLKSDANALAPALARELGAAREATGRAASRIVRNAVRVVERAEAAARFPGIVNSDATPSRIPVEQAWYVRFPFGRSILAGGLTLMLVVLPIIIISSQEALRAVPRSLRQASLAMGATPWQTIWRVTLPSGLPGIMTGVILAMSRAIGEAAPILIIAGIVYITFTPDNLMDDFTAMPLQVYNWASRPQKEFYDIAAAGIILLLLVLLLFNGLAVYIRQRTQKGP
jgi:phosphate transport system permease protein